MLGCNGIGLPTVSPFCSSTLHVRYSSCVTAALLCSRWNEELCRTFPESGRNAEHRHAILASIGYIQQEIFHAISFHLAPRTNYTNRLKRGSQRSKPRER